MPEPNPAPAPDEPDGSTAGWTQPAPARDRDPSGRETVTHTLPSTPAPADPARQTISENTDRISPVNSDGTPRPPDIAGYRVERIIGRGGMGIVYRAVDLTLNRVVALKVLHPGARDPGHVLGRFDREVKALAEIEHPNVVRIYDADYWHGFPYFTMQFVPGGPLSRQMARFRGDRRAGARLVAKVARAVQALHDHKVIHRDLKPLNILLGNGDEPLVADFGLAKWLDDPNSDCSATGHPLGTRQYMAPEQTLGKRSDYSTACDVWSLGVILYELLAGRRPFVDDGRMELMKRIREEPPPSLPEAIPADLAAIVEKCLAKEPADRYATAAAVADDLEAWMEGRPVSVRPARPANRWVRAVTLVGIVALIALPPLAMIGGAPVPPNRKKTVAERVAEGETVYLTDKFGKPTVPTTSIGRDEPQMGRRDDFHHFTSKPHAMVQLLRERLPLPVRLEGDIAIPFPATGAKFGFGGLYVGERAWLGGPVDHRSAVWLYLAPFADPGRAGRRSIEFRSQLYRWEAAKPLSRSDFRKGNSDWGRDPKQDAEPRFVPIIVDIHSDALHATIDGVRYPPITTEAIRLRLRRDAESDRRFAAYPYAQPVLGDGIGITLNDTELIVRNLRLSRPDR
jgi:eukaryotic-like serine/threonine-protein kinase